MRAGFLCPICDNFACLRIRQDQNELHLKRWFLFAKIGIFCKSIAGPLSEAKTHWMVNWLQLQNQLNFIWRYTKVFIQNDVSEMFNCWERRWIDVDGTSRILSATAAIFSGARTVFGFSPVASFFHFFHKISNIRSWRWFSSSKIRTQFSHIFFNITYDFQSNVAIFPSVVQTYTQPYSFGGRIKLIICQIRYELSVTIHEISTSWKKKTLDGVTNIKLTHTIWVVWETRP